MRDLFSQPLFVLAPLAGYTDLPFRRVVKKFGADLTVSEMISSNALVHNPDKTRKLAQKDPAEDPYAVQIAGNDPTVIARAVELLCQMEGIDIIDLNSGCPAPKIVNHGSGSALLKDLVKLEKIVATIKKRAGNKLTSVKIRIGYESRHAAQIARVCEAAGADFITVHGRTRAGKFEAPVDYDEIKAAKEAVGIPVIANGDITSYEKAQWVLEHTGCDGVMIGRGAIGAPWIFYQLKHGQSALTPEIRKAIVLEHFDAMISWYDTHGVALFRKHLHTYSKGMNGGSDFRQAINHMDDPEEVRNLIEAFFTPKESA
ncbi:MAG: tRNA dihydrouridine synthase DusB [Campylobacterales bacterium]